MTDKMNNLKLTKWLQIVWDALREQDDLKRSRMLRVADRLLKASNQQALASRRTQNSEYGIREPEQRLHRKRAVELRTRIN